MLLPAHRAVLMGGTRALMRQHLAARFDASIGITAAGGFASQWADQSGNARNLLQATGANQPVHLPAGVNNADTAQAGSTGTTLNLAASALAFNDAYNDMTVTLTGGTGSGQTRTITDYVGATKVATVAAWSVTPDNTTTYSISASSPSLLFDGTAHFMKCAAFTLNQPETIYLVAKQVAWGSRFLCDGNASNSMVIFQNTASPQLALYAGAFSSNNANAAIGAKAVIAGSFNGAASALRVNLTAEVGGNVGAANAGGFTLGSNPTPGSFANIQVYEALIYNVAHTAAQRASIQRALMSRHGVT